MYQDRLAVPHGSGPTKLILSPRRMSDFSTSRNPISTTTFKPGVCCGYAMLQRLEPA